MHSATTAIKVHIAYLIFIYYCNYLVGQFRHGVICSAMLQDQSVAIPTSVICSLLKTIWLTPDCPYPSFCSVHHFCIPSSFPFHLPFVVIFQCEHCYLCKAFPLVVVHATPPTLWRTQETNPASGVSSTPSTHTRFRTLRTPTPQCRNQGELHRDTRGDGYTSQMLWLNHRGWIGPPIS